MTRRRSSDTAAFLLLMAVACLACGSGPSLGLVDAAMSEDPAALVDPFIGTDDGTSPDPPPGDSGGSTFPGAAFPFGMVQWSPDTAPRAEFSYRYSDDTILGFSVNHISGTGCPALGDFPVLPVTDGLSASPGPSLSEHAQPFSHDGEEASIGNEPAFTTPYLYNFISEPRKTQRVVRRIVTRTFTDGPGGLPGNDDMGATSSWLVWAHVGLFPAVPGVGGFSLASPLFPRVEVRLADGGTLEIRAPGAAADRPLVDRVRVDGEVLPEPWIPWERVSSGGVVEFDLSAHP